MDDHTPNPAALAEQIVKALYDDDTALCTANHTDGAFDVDAYCVAQAEVVMPILAAAFAAVRVAVERQERILAALREPSAAVLDAATAAMQDAFFAFRVRHLAYDMDTQYAMDTLEKLPAIKSPPPALREQQDKVFVAGVRAAVAAAEQEVDRG